jgi:hypothetical protein
MKNKKLDDWQAMPQNRDFESWFGQWVISSIALKFYHKTKRFPSFFKKSSVQARGRYISMELK